jgi:hypothetical protein
MKLTAKDLRVGNIIRFAEDGQIFTVNTIEEFGMEGDFSEETTWIEYDQFEPIPLTEEWLDKLPKEEFDFVGLGIRVICVKFPAIQYEFTENKIWVYFNDETINIVDYVHEWQNIHHSLTREELQLNQTA